MSDLLGTGFGTCRAQWAEPLPHEHEAPDKRLIHARVLNFAEPARLDRLGVKLGKGFHKCGSLRYLDWVRDVRVLGWVGHRWEVLREDQALPRPADDDGRSWLDLGGARASSVVIEARRADVDGWWPCWNLVSDGFVLEGAAPEPARDRAAGLLRVGDVDVGRLPAAVTAERLPGEVRYRTPFLEVGFRLRRPGLAYLSLDDEGLGRTSRNLLRHGIGFTDPLRDYWHQGVRLVPTGAAPVADFLDNDAEGTSEVAGNVVTYTVRLGSGEQRYRLQWQVLEEAVVLTAERHADRDLRAWDSSACQLSFDTTVSASTVLGRVIQQGQAGLVELPALLSAPGFGALRIDVRDGNALWRADSARPVSTTTSELKLGEVPQPEGDYLLRAGDHRATVALSVTAYEPGLAGDAPAAVERAVRRCTIVAMPYRPDIASLANNGNSLHCPIEMDGWSALATRVGRLLPNLTAEEMLRDSLDRWLLEAPGYASGRHPEAGRTLDDEYLLSGAACLQGLADHLLSAGSVEWLAARADDVHRELGRMRRRDVDDDGLIESTYRLGISGEHQWGTNWYDITSFGWKDAWANAVLYTALLGLATALPIRGQPELAAGLDEWAHRLRANYASTFYNPETGWLGGWRSKDGVLHDHAHLAVNGAAVAAGLLDDELSLQVVRRLWNEMDRVGFTEFGLGLPTTLRRIPDEDMARPFDGLPLGWYQNGAANHSQARHFLAALYKVGMTAEADLVLTALCETLADGSAFGGVNTGVDWRRWDGLPSGYEGLLCAQLGVLVAAFDRYDTRRR